MSREQAVYSLTRPRGAARLIGAPPHHEDGTPLAPFDRYGDDHLWWLDRMVRSDQPLVERLTLVFHDWFATANEKVDSQRQMIDQNNLLRSHALGSFADLFKGITVDPAMLIWLDGSSNTKDDVNENYAREMMELFSLGAGRGAYTERDVREQARSLTGWTNDYSDSRGNFNFRYDPALHDDGTKSVFGKTGRWGWSDAVRLCLEHPLHTAYFVTKLWSYFIPVSPSSKTVADLGRIYRSSGYSIRAVVEAILLHDAFYAGPAMVKPPIVYTAGILRALGRGIDTGDWVYHARESGQQLFHPPNVSGWTKDKWLDTSTFRARWGIAQAALDPRHIVPDDAHHPYSSTETPSDALDLALSFAGKPALTSATRSYLQAFSRTCMPPPTYPGQRSVLRALRQNALRHLVLTCPDYQVS
jgi:uncharacterized protein (DUF1800 family)